MQFVPPRDTLRVDQALRSWTDQAKLFAQGRTTPGEVVTDAAPGYSWHEFGLAFDVVPLDVDLIPDWVLTHPIWQDIVTAGEALGLSSGSDFTHRKDTPHFQLTGRFPVTPTDAVRRLYQSSGMQAVWDAAGIG